MAQKEISVIIRARSAVAAGLNKAKASIGKFAKGVGSLLASAARGFAALGASAIGLGAYFVKAASDAEETAGKFNVTFAAVRTEADRVAESFAKNFGLAKDESKQLLADTGDLLSGFGFTGKAALDMSQQVNELAVDLASFTNFSGGAKGASEALTKALLGERESVKSLGIAILDKDVKARVAINNAKGMTFETERQAKAFATLQLAQEQSKNAIGDFARTSDSFANRQRVLAAKLRDARVAMGQQIVEGTGLAEVFGMLAAKVESLTESGLIELWSERVTGAFGWIADKAKPIIGLFARIKKGIQQGAAIAGAMSAGSSFDEAVNIAATTPDAVKKDEDNAIARVRARQAARKKAADEAIASEEKIAAAAEAASLKEASASNDAADAERKRLEAKKLLVEDTAKAQAKAASQEKAAITEIIEAAQDELAAKQAVAAMSIGEIQSGKEAQKASEKLASQESKRAARVEASLARRGGKDKFLNKKDREFLAAFNERKGAKAAVDAAGKAILEGKDQLKGVDERLLAAQESAEESLKNIEETLKSNLAVGGAL